MANFMIYFFFVDFFDFGAFFAPFDGAAAALCCASHSVISSGQPFMSLGNTQFTSSYRGGP